MRRSVFVDASPLIFLAGSDLLELLDRPEWDVEIPAAVRAEIVRRGIGDATVRALATAGWIRSAEAVAVPDEISSEDLGPGESEALALAMSRPGSLLVIDDGAARRAADRLSVRVVGTLGLVLAAK
jgi:predicted nucleic acid-binding protein